MTRLSSFCSGVLEVVNAVAVRLEDVVGEWVDGLEPRPPTKGVRSLAAAEDLLLRWNEDDVIRWTGSASNGQWVIGVSNDRLEDLIDDTSRYIDVIKGRR